MEANNNALDERQLTKWLNDEYNFLERSSQRVGAIVSNRMPRRFRLLPITAWIAKTALACSAPGLALLYGSLSVFLAALGAGVLFVGNLTAELLGQWNKVQARAKTDHSMIVRLGEFLNSVQTSTIRSGDGLETAIGGCLGIIESCCRAVTRSEAEEISVTLLEYADLKHRDLVLIRRRNPGNTRPTGSKVPSANLLGHQACIADPSRPHIVHKLKKFGKAAATSPTQSQVTYQAIFIIPLQTRANGKSVVKGFVSVDCSRPYAFYGNRGRDITVYCRPVVNLLADMI